MPSRSTVASRSAWTPDPAELSALATLRERPRRALLVVPHPDDESYGCAGTLARLAADRDCAVAMLFLTSGEAASVGKVRQLAPSELATIREGRLENVRSWLGVDRLHLARLPDGKLSRLPLGEVAASVRTVVDALAPQVVLGHDPRGVNAHPDHIATHWAVRTALPGSEVRRFAMVVHDEEEARSAAPRLLFSTPEERIHCTIRLTEDEVSVKERCLVEHEAIITLDPTTAAENEISLRSPIEQWEFLGEADGVAVGGLFDALPPTLPAI